MRRIAGCQRHGPGINSVYILDDSSDREIMRKIDRFASRFEHVQVVRGKDRQGFKAGNLNHALAGVVTEPLFVIADSDEIPPRDFLSTLVPRINGDPNCGFIQANHRCLQHGTKLQKDMCHGVDVHWFRRSCVSFLRCGARPFACYVS